MTDPTNDLAALRAAAEKATPGPWRSDAARSEVHAGIASVVGTCSRRSNRDADFIAKANPATVLWLLDRVEALERELSAAKANPLSLLPPRPEADGPEPEPFL